MIIDGLDPAQRVLIVAEIGNNHEGDVALARELVRRAAEAGADAVKFQTFRTEHYVPRRDAARFKQLQAFQLTIDQFARLRDDARSCGLRFLSTPFDLQSARGLADFVDAYKIASGDLTFAPLLEAVAATGKPIVLSTGMAALEPIAAARALVHDAWRRRGVGQELALLHCVSSYPVPPEQANLAAIATLGRTFGGIVGYSDHALGIDVAVASVAAGARILEKHFTIAHDHSAFRDHRLSADPGEMAEMVRRVREVERWLGDGVKAAQPCEREAIPLLRRSIAAGRTLPAGAVVEPGDLTWLRGSGGVPAGEEARVIGCAVIAPVAAGEMIHDSVLAGEACTP